jgi:hypothetical protein
LRDQEGGCVFERLATSVLADRHAVVHRTAIEEAGLNKGMTTDLRKLRELRLAFARPLESSSVLRPQNSNTLRHFRKTNGANECVAAVEQLLRLQADLAAPSPSGYRRAPDLNRNDVILNQPSASIHDARTHEEDGDTTMKAECRHPPGSDCGNAALPRSITR